MERDDRALCAGTPRTCGALAGLAESGAIRPAIDRTYPLAGGGEAIRQIAGAHATGKGVVVI
jgi:NADPH:quinone reductase-like Zn-dependent oxidoreductase